MCCAVDLAAKMKMKTKRKRKRKRKIVGLGFSKLIGWVTFEQVESFIEDFF